MSAYIKAIAKGILKVMSKMGICTFQSYCGAQIFDAIGLQRAISSTSISPAPSRPIGGAGLDEIAEETVRRHRLAFGDAPNYRDALDVGGELAFRVSGETPCLDLGHGVAAAACGARQQLPQVQGIHPPRRRAGRRPRLAARPARLRLRGRARAARGSRAGRRNRQALLDRRHVLRLDLVGSAHDAWRSP